MARRRLDAMLLFAPESHYWLTGYDTFGYCFFQCLVLTREGAFTLLTRSADLRQARHTSIIENIVVWEDAAGAAPAPQLRDLLDDLGLLGARIGVEYDTHGLTAANGRALDEALKTFGTIEDASDLIPPLRAVKSPAEIAYVRRAAALADDALDAGLALIRPGADEGDILAAMQGAVFSGGGDYPGNPFIVGSGEDALLCRIKSGRRKLGESDQITLEFAGVYRLYHVALMRTVMRGRAQRAASRVACRLRRGARRLRGGDAAREHFRRGLRRACQGHGRARHDAASAERLRLFARRPLRAVLDGLADVLPRQPGDRRARHGALRAHDPDGFRFRRGDVPGPDLPHHGGRAGAAVAAWRGDGGAVIIQHP